MKVFISYRRKSWPFTQRLAEELGKLIDADIFVDYSGIDETDFEHSILTHLRTSDAVLVIVTEYTFAPDRINQADDWVRREIGLALQLKKPIVLVAVDGRFPPPVDQLPEDLRDITRIQGIAFYPDFFDAALQKLANFITKATSIKLRRHLVPNPGSSASGLVIPVALVVAALIIVVGIALINGSGPRQDPLQLTIEATVQAAVINTHVAQTIVALAKPAAISLAEITATAMPTALPGVPEETNTPTPDIRRTIAIAVAATNYWQATKTIELLTRTPTRMPTLTPPPPSFNLAVTFPAPLPKGFVVTTEYGAGGSYPGIALAAPVGSPITPGGNGVVVQIIQCTKCTAAAPSFFSAGIQYNSPAFDVASRDPAWGYGWGNAVMIRFAYPDLPGKLRAQMDNAGFRDGYAYVLYSHLSRIDVQEGQTIRPDTVIGLSGNTGNSTGPHLTIQVGLDRSADLNAMPTTQTTNPRDMYEF